MAHQGQSAWQDRLHALWRTAFSAANTKVFSNELYLGLLSLPGVRGVLGVRLGGDGQVRVVRWADEPGGVRTAPPGLAAEVQQWLADGISPGHAHGQARVTGVPLAELARRAPALAARTAEVGGAGLAVSVFPVPGGEHGLVVLAVAELPTSQAVLGALAQVADVVIAADGRIKDQEALDDRLAVDAMLAEASLRLAGSLDIEETLRSVVRLAVPGVADGAAVHIRRGHRMEHIAAAHVDAHREQLLGEHLRTGRWAGEEVVRANRRSSADDKPRPSGLAEEVGLSLMTITVLRARGRNLGLLSFFHRDGARRPPSREFLRDLAARAALAIDNAQLYDQRRQEVSSLQKHLLPSVLPEVEGLELAAAYNVADHRLDVGGDFYGVVRQPGGLLTALIGDVCGRGAPAAALTGLARHTVETMLEEGGDPAEAVRLLNKKMLRGDVGRFLTLATATFGTPTPAGLPLRSLTAGHPSPLLVRRDGAVAEADCRGALVGVLAELGLEPAEDVLRPGDSVVLYTDGLPEARDGAGVFFGDGDLAPTISGLREEPLTGMVNTLVAGAGRFAVDDDVAVLAIRYRGPRALHTVLPPAQAEEAALAAVRRVRGGHAVLPESLRRHLTALGREGTPEVRVVVDGDEDWTRVEAGTAWALL
ncbi:serine phosphatase RsbU (regulator of sigma subunit) [Crossiella equi]|uniref:Serine phosphatase RsbU (Regulator of sigma subunit) n=1 Tax=Crossiella equi TaxID=130796 RepID=A0ABS5A6D2_9PSEU|nr:PP2C family protein-serine/threonine phosphatase [Crossiella equi]MBP2472158.1 serine phosphatase RsbU (regulator of sigma subunit) [Crossiella equi]